VGNLERDQFQRNCQTSQKGSAYGECKENLSIHKPRQELKFETGQLKD
jgi:hypothetical protein